MKRFIAWIASLAGLQLATPVTPLDRALELRGDPDRLMLNPSGGLSIQGAMQLSQMARVVDSAYAFKEAHPDATGQNFANWWYDWGDGSV